MSSAPESEPLDESVPDSTPAAAPHDGAASGKGETSFADAETAGEAPESRGPEDAESIELEAEVAEAARPTDDDAQRYLALAQRTQADFENFRKRSTRESALARDRGKSALAREILPALDHLDLALSAADQDPAAAEFVKGMRLVQDELTRALSRAGIEAYSPLDEPFDPEQHEAMAQHPVEGVASGQVVEVYQQGYRLGAVVLRPARVVVSA